MKRETFRHPKTLDLAARTKAPRPLAIGYLALMWDFVADAAPQGDIGKWPNGAISRACDWMGDPDEFIAAMVAAGWLDDDAEFRLVVHDWPDHCERWVHLKLARLKLSFLPCYKSTGPPAVASTDGSIGLTLPRDRTEPNRTEPIQTVIDESSGGDGFVDSIRSTANRYVKTIGPPRTPSDSSLVLKVAVMVESQRIAAASVETVLESLRVSDPPIRKPYGYLHKSLKNAVENFNGLLKTTKIPKELLNGNKGIERDSGPPTAGQPRG